MSENNGYREANEKAASAANGLDKMSSLIRTLGADASIKKLSEDIQLRAKSLREDRFSIVVIGGFSKGKSTLLNALLGKDILPRKVIPSTAIITKLEYNDEPHARICYLDTNLSEERLSLDEFKTRFVYDEKDNVDVNDESDRFSNVDYAVVGYPLELCRYRVELVDSPGLKAHPIHTKKTREFLKNADAVVMVLDAQNLFDLDERDFLETILLPEGLTNIFFVINKWNLIEQSVYDPQELEIRIAELESRIRTHLSPFCRVNGKDISAERIFRVNALGAQAARTQIPLNESLLTSSNILTFEKALQNFLLKDRARAKNEVIRSSLKVATDEIVRFITTQQVLGEKSLEEIEKEIKNLKPKFDRLKGIRQHIINFLEAKSSNLQDSLVTSYAQHIDRKVLPQVGKMVDKLDFSNIFGWFATKDVIADYWRKDDSEKKLKNKIEKFISPQIQKWFSQEMIEWRNSVTQNLIPAAQIDVEQHLKEEAQEYRRVLREIEEQLGVQGRDVSIEELIKSWLHNPADKNQVRLNVSGLGAFGDLSWLIGGIAIDVAAEVMLHASTIWIPVIGLLISSVRLVMRENRIRKEMRAIISKSVTEKLVKSKSTQAAELKQKIQDSFKKLETTLTENINEQIALIEASLQTILDNKKNQEFSLAESRKHLDSVRDELEIVTNEINLALAV